MNKYEKEIIENGFNPMDFKIIGNGFFPVVDLNIRDIAKSEDTNLLGTIEYNSAMGTLEILQLSEENIKDIQLDISQSDFEMIMMISDLSKQVEILKSEIDKLVLKGGSK